MNFSNRPYLIEKKSGAIDCIIRPFHYYEAKTNKRNGKHKCTVGITTDDEDWMLPETARFCDLSYTFRPGYYGADNVRDVDGTMSKPLMSAHEMGHATGHFDDYLYNLDDGGFTYSGVPSFSQPYTAPGGPYNIDSAARMRFCRLPRMRDLWHFVNWLNDDAKAGKPLHAHLKGSTFRMTYAFTDPTAGAKRTIQLDLDDPRYRNTCKPSFEKLDFSSFGNGNVALHLYRLGGGETAETAVAGHKFDGVLMIAVKIAVKFVGMPSNLDRRNWLLNCLVSNLNGLNAKFYLQCTSANTFRKTLLGITPYFSIYTGASKPADAHFGVVVDNATASDIVTAGQIINVKRTVNGMKIVRHIFGLTSASVANLVKGDFGTVATWIGRNDVANGTFSVENL